MLFLRLLGKCLLFAAFIALAYDGTRVLASPGEGILLTSLSTHLQNHVPDGQANLQRFFLDHAPSYLWNGIVEPMLVLPVSVLFGIIGTLLFIAGYRKPPPEIIGD